MIDVSILITGGVGIVSTIGSGWASWFFTRKKYNSEVNHNVIENMETSLEFYKKLSDDNRARLEEMAERNKTLESEVQELRKQVLNLTMNICLDLTCERRMRERQIITKKKNGKNKDRFDETESTSGGGSQSTSTE
jgi:TRAP-type C4-dicarboxylate transport system substrate-binding protein